MGHRISGVYQIIPDGMVTGYAVYCDMDTDGGGWLVLQRREDGSVEFNRDWIDYQIGFGNVSHEHWLGFIPLERIMIRGYYELRIDLVDWRNDQRYAEYKVFSIASKGNYKITIAGYSGTAGDAMTYQNGMSFSTYDKDNDKHDTLHCAGFFKGAWWHRGCTHSNLNGKYYKNSTEHHDGVFWRSWHDDGQDRFIPMKKVEMKIRRY